MKFIKTFILIVFFCLTGCGVVTKEDIDEAEKLCESNGGLKHVFVRNIEIECRNGATFSKGDA